MDSRNLLNGDSAALGYSALAAGTTTTTTFGAIAFRIGAKTYTKAAGTATTTPTTDANTGAAFVAQSYTTPQTCVYVFGFNAAGDFKCAQGTPVTTTAYTGKNEVLRFPKLPVDFCPIGWEIVSLGATAVATWTMGTNNQSAVTGVTYTFVPAAFLPSQPIAA